VPLGRRGTTFVREVAGPPGAPVLLLLHGWTVNADLNWFACYEALGRHFRVLAMDHRGHGRGIRSWWPFQLEDCADDAAALAEQLGVELFVAVGYSMGGPVAQLAWRRHPDRVAGVVLSATSASFGSNPGAQIYFSSLLGLSMAARLTPSPVRRRVTGNVIRRRVPRGLLADWWLAEMDRNSVSAVLEAGWALGRFDSRPWVGSMDVPTAVVVTQRDAVVPPHRQRALAASIPGATVHPADADHASCVTEPERFVPALVDACTSVAVRAGLASPAPAGSGLTA
jgi:3-oxoadipate enol-lactonase